MDQLSSLVNGFAAVLQPEILLLGFIGCVLGTFVGVLPGIGPLVGIALLLPVVYNFEATGALVMLAGVYYGSMYGGSTTSILLNTPGEASSVATTLDGFPMSRAGRGGAALATAAIGSFVAGTIALCGLVFLAPLVAQIAVNFQPADYFALVVLALITVTSLVGRSVVRGLISLSLGLFVGLIGLDGQTGQVRFTFGLPELYGGLDVILFVIGLFALGETFYVASRLRYNTEELVAVRGGVWMNREEWSRSWKPWLRGSVIGFPMGAMPAGGSEVPTFLSYTLEKRLSRHPEQFGHGAIEGVAGPEAANNSAFSGVMVPLLTLGIPTSATAAILLSSFQIFNIQPGPLLFEQHPEVVWSLIASLYVGNVMLLLLNLPLVKLWVKLLEIPRSLLHSGIIVFAMLGIYSVANSEVELFIALAIGLAALVMRRYDFPLGPAILGMILGPLLETYFRRAMSVELGDLTVFVTRPLSLSLLLLAVLAVLTPPIVGLVRRRKNAGYRQQSSAEPREPVTTTEIAPSVQRRERDRS